MGSDFGSLLAQVDVSCDATAFELVTNGAWVKVVDGHTHTKENA